jgi:hypothetical protein
VSGTAAPPAHQGLPDRTGPQSADTTAYAVAVVRRCLVLPAVASATTIAAVTAPDPTALAVDQNVQVVAGLHGAAVLFAVSLLGVVAAAAVALGARGAGPAVGMTLGPLSAVLAIPLSRDVADPWQFAVVFGFAALGFGGLVSASLCVAGAYGGRMQPALVLAWVVPLLAFSVDASRAQWAPRGVLRFAPVMADPNPAVLAVACGFAVSWGVLSLFAATASDVVARPASARWEHRAAAVGLLLLVCVAVAALGLVVTVNMGSLTASWLRAWSVTFTLAAVVAIVSVVRMLRPARFAVGYLVLVIVGLVVLPVTSLAFGRVVVEAGTTAMPAAVVSVVAAAAATGSLVGWWHGGSVTVLLALIGTGLALAATTPMSGEWWWPTLSGAALAGLLACACVASLRGVLAAAAGSGPERLGFIAVGFVLAAVVGRSASIGVAGWALSGDVPSTAAGLVAAGRVACGLGLVVVTAVATYAALVARDRVRRVARETGVTFP